jgi:cysteine desulfurase
MSRIHYGAPGCGGAGSVRVMPPITYLDHAATTAMRPEAVAAMLPYLTEDYGNPSGAHAAGRAARRALDEAREVVATSLRCRPSEVVFTGCGTEADNMAITGVLARHGGTAVCTAVEHHAVLHPVEHAGGRVVGVDAHGVVDLDQLAAALDERVRVVSVMLVNNETGTIQPLRKVTRLVSKRAPHAVVHTDAVQAVTWVDVAEAAAHAQLVSISAHKFGGPKGVGALVVRDGVHLEPLLLGGGQEHDRRSGTQNVAGIVAMAEALRLTVAERDRTNVHVGALRDRLVDGLLATVPGLVETVPREHKVAGSAHVCIDGIENEALLFLLDREGICASAASSCASGAMDPSHVLAAMGVPKERALGSLRLTLGPTSTDSDVDRALAVIPAAVAQLRGGRP